MAPPVTATSTRFIAISMPIMEISDIPMAVLKALARGICRSKIRVSRAMDVRRPFMIANDMMAHTGHGVPVI
jgi:hypothetical protein